MRWSTSTGRPHGGAPKVTSFFLEKHMNKNMEKDKSIFQASTLGVSWDIHFFCQTQKSVWKLIWISLNPIWTTGKKTSQTSILFAQQFKCGCFRWHFNITCGYLVEILRLTKEAAEAKTVQGQDCAAKGQTWLDVRNVIQQMANIHLRFGEFLDL